jgi:hypothetical protein
MILVPLAPDIFEGDGGELYVRILQELLYPLLFRGNSPDELPLLSGEIPELPYFLGGMKLPLTSPLLGSLPGRPLSFTSVFLPGTFLTCRAFTGITSKLSSTMLNTGFP